MSIRNAIAFFCWYIAGAIMGLISSHMLHPNHKTILLFSVNLILCFLGGCFVQKFPHRGY